MSTSTGRATSSRGGLKPVDFLVLAILCDGPLHGYGIASEIGERTEGRIRLRPGDVYRVLYRMQREDLIEAFDGSPDDGEDAERRAYYRITGHGRDVARTEAEMLAGIASRLLTQTSGSE